MPYLTFRHPHRRIVAASARLVPNATAYQYVFTVPTGYRGRILEATITTPTAFASAGGTITLTLQRVRGSGADLTVANLSASFDLEGLAVHEVGNISLNATASDLQAGDRIRLAVVSNNADATGGEGNRVSLWVELRPG